MPVGISAALSVGSSVAGGILGSNAASNAAQAAQAAAAQANAGLQGVENQSTANLQPFINTGQNANSALAGLLGIGGNAQTSRNAFNNYLGSTNYQFQLGQGEKAIETANAPSFNSSATAKALNNYAQGQAGSALSGYESQLGGLGALGAQSGFNLGELGNQNLGLQGQNLLAAAGATGSADLAGANAWTNALKGVDSGLSSFGSGGTSALGSLFSPGTSGGNQGAGGGTPNWFAPGGS